MTEYNQYNSGNQNNPSGIWQHIWVTLIMQAIEQFSSKNYMGTWRTLKLLKTELPPECDKDCQKNYDVIEALLKKSIKGYDQQNAEERRSYYIHTELPGPLLELLGAIRTSLFDHSWINKNFSAKPKYAGEGVI